MAIKSVTGTAEVANQKPETVIVDKVGTKPANVPAATEFDPSGAPIQVASDVDPSHPAVDDNPRKGTSIDQNRIDFNDPTISSQEAVEKALGYTSDGRETEAKKSDDK